MMDKYLARAIQEAAYYQEYRKMDFSVDPTSFIKGVQFVIDFLDETEALIWRPAAEIVPYSKRFGSVALVIARKYDLQNGMEYKLVNVNDLGGFKMDVFVAARYEWAVLSVRPSQEDLEKGRRKLNWVSAVEKRFQYPMTPGECFDPVKIKAPKNIIPDYLEEKYRNELLDKRP